MSWLSWFSRDPKKASGASRDAFLGSGSNKSASSHRSPDPIAASASSASQRGEQRRSERNSRRELLFQVVRESMVRVGVLSSAFRFKVLSLDQRGRSFLVMVELSAEFSGEADKLAEIEAMIAQTARQRFDIIVQAVYWRYFNASSAPQSVPSSAPAPLLGAMHAPISRPAPLFPMDASGQSSTHPSPAVAPVARPAPAPTQRHDELSADEIAAFRNALAAGASVAQATASVAASKNDAHPAAEAAHNKLLLTGFEDTEMVGDDPMPALSGTQYGELR